MRIALVNPNSSAATAEAMLRIARPRTPEAEMAGLTAPFGAALIHRRSRARGGRAGGGGRGA